VSTSFIDVPGGRLACSDVGAGPLVVAVPGMGDLRSTYRFLAPKLVAAGYRVISLDLRGHGESSVRWDDYAVGAVAADILALVAALNAGPAHIIGNSMAAGAAVIAAARKPEAIRSLTLVGPFVRDMMPPWVMSALFRPLMVGPWGAALWRMLYKKSFPTRPPDDFAAEVARRNVNLAEAGRFTALRRMLLASKAEAERRTADVTAPALVLMGSRDTDFPNPAKEAQHVADLVQGTVAMIEGAGHYPQAEMPDTVAAQLIPFFASVDAKNAEHHAS
jgi:pimeloyl-ACP methyl ester carboxylesterase